MNVHLHTFSLLYLSLMMYRNLEYEIDRKNQILIYNYLKDASYGMFDKRTIRLKDTC